MRILVISSMICSGLVADPVLLNAGDKSPYQGMLFTLPEAQSIRKDLFNLKGMSELNDSLNKSLSIHKENYGIESKKNQILEDRNNSLAQALQGAQKGSELEKILLVGFGFAAALVGAFIIKRAQ